MVSGKKDKYIDVTIKIRSPIINKEYDTVYRDVLKIKKIYPQFNLNGDVIDPDRLTVKLNYLLIEY